MTGEDTPPRLKTLLDMPTCGQDIQLEHAWNGEDRSYNIFVEDDDPLTFCRHPVAQSTDGIRGKVGYRSGLHVFEVTWLAAQRGTNAVVGVATGDAPLHCRRYRNLVGSNEHSWGWDLVRNKAHHGSESRRGRPYPEANQHGGKPFVAPDRFLAVLDTDEGVLGFAADGRYLGPASRGLRGKRLYLAASATWGHCEVTMKYIGRTDQDQTQLIRPEPGASHTES